MPALISYFEDKQIASTILQIDEIWYFILTIWSENSGKYAFAYVQRG